MNKYVCIYIYIYIYIWQQLRAATPVAEWDAGDVNPQLEPPFICVDISMLKI